MAEPKLKPKGYLRSKITDPAISREVSALTEAVATIAADNKTPFFPAYTDHGIDHLQAVLDWCVKLTPKGARRLLVENDAAVVIGGALLHDVAMHLHVPGFIELVGGDWPAPLPWFDRAQGGRRADRPWDQLWDDFKAEARHFDHVEIVRLLGADHDGTPTVVLEDEIRRTTLDEADKLYIGEFLRRHHARLAHEIAVHGFPGLGDAFPTAEPGLPTTLRELMGLVARSHNEDLRLIVDHMKDHRGSTERSGVHVPYAAALLRIADFAQLDFRRAPSLLLRMAAPQSQISIDEWAKHKAVELVIDDGDDPDAIRIEVSSEIGLHTYLQLEELFDGLQHELDTCSAVLAEVYGSSRRLAPLRLAKRRLRHNMSSPEFQDALPFVPRESRLRSAQDMFRLVIHDLYGDHPWVAGRELAQNALDAVRERSRLRAAGPVVASDPRWPDPTDPSVDVLVEVAVEDDDQLSLRIADRGVGMTADTVVDYFLKAGASLGPTPRELAEMPEGEAARYVKAGRFGIGVLAAFLLGDEVEVRTRHLAEPTGLSFTARLDSDLVPITRGVRMPVGTEVRVRVAGEEHAAIVADIGATGRTYLGSPSNREIRRSHFDLASALAWPIRASCYMASPKVKVGVRHGDRTSVVPMDLPGGWHDVDTEVDGRVRWRPGEIGVVVNGIRVFDPKGLGNVNYRYAQPSTAAALETPLVAIDAHGRNLDLTLNRYALRSPFLPFEDDLVRSLAFGIMASVLVHPRTPNTLLRVAWRNGVEGPAGHYAAVPGLAVALDLPTIHAVVDLRPSGLRREVDLAQLDFGPAAGAGHHVWRTSRHNGSRGVDISKSLQSTVTDLSRGLKYLGTRVVEVLYCGQLSTVSDGLRRAADHIGLDRVRILSREEGLDHPVLRPILNASDDAGAVAVIGRRRPHGATSILVETWMEVVGGAVPYDEGEREALAERVYAEHAEIRPHMDRQRRLAKATRWSP